MRILKPGQKVTDTLHWRTMIAKTCSTQVFVLAVRAAQKRIFSDVSRPTH